MTTETIVVGKGKGRLSVCMARSTSVVAHMRFRAIALLCLVVLSASLQAQYVEDSVYVGGNFVWGVTYNPYANVIYAPSEQHDFIAVIDCSTNQVTARIEINAPYIPVLDTVDKKAYCLSGLHRDSVGVIDALTHTRLTDFTMLSFTRSSAWSSVLNRLYVSLWELGQVAVIDCRADTEICRIDVGHMPGAVVVNDRHGRLYAHDNDDARLSIIDLATNAIIRSIPLGIEVVSEGLYSDVTDRYYFTGDGYIFVIDGAGDSLVAFYDPPENARGVVVLPEHSVILMSACTNQRPDTVFALDMNSGEVLRRLVVGNTPHRLFRSPFTGLVYCVNKSTDDVSVIASDGSRVLTTLTAGDTPGGVCFVPATGRAYLSHHNGYHVYVLKDTVGVPGIAGGPERQRLGSLDATPNPFRHRVTLTFTGGSDRARRLGVYSSDGRLVRALTMRGVGLASRAEWDGKDETGKEVPQGAYHVRSACGTQVLKRLVKLD